MTDKSPSCGNCRFFRREGKGGGSCHANPPTVLMVGFMQDPLTRHQRPLINSYWPSVREDEWCRLHPHLVNSVDLTGLDLSRLQEEGTA